MLFADAATYDIAAWEITIHPDFNDPFLVDSNVLLFNFKAAISLCYQIKSIQGLWVEMEKVRIGDMFDIDQSDRYLLDE